MNPDFDQQPRSSQNQGGAFRHTNNDLSEQKGIELAMAQDHESFVYRLGRACRKNFRWWHIGLALALPTFAGYRYSISHFFGLLAVEMLVASCAIFFHWLTDDLKRARAAILLLVMAPLSPMLGRLLNPFFGPQQPIGGDAVQQHSNFQSPSKDGQQPPRSGQPESNPGDRLQRQDATLSYWQIAVADLHRIRFESPTGNEPASQFYERMYAELGRLTSLADSAPTSGVDQDVVHLARRHLAVEHRLLSAKVKSDRLLKSAGVPAESDTIADRIAQGEGIFTAVLADPTLLDKLPGSELKSLFKELFDLEQQRLEQYREIEIMQAVLEERYSGTKFLLPKVN